MENLLSIFLILSVAVICAVYAGAVAGEKGHDWVAWTVGGFLFGPLALLAVIGLPDRNLRRYLRLIAEKQGIEVEPRPLGLKGPEYRS